LRSLRRSLRRKRTDNQYKAKYLPVTEKIPYARQYDV
jgi:hypothetical protein